MTNLQGQISNFLAWVATAEGKAASWNNLLICFSVAAILAFVLLVLYLYKSRQMHRERELKDKIALLILHLCDAYDQVEEWNFDSKTAAVYSVDSDIVEVTQRSIEGPGELLQDMYPEDAAKYPEEKLKLLFERVMKTCA